LDAAVTGAPALYAGTNHAGVFQSADSGGTWMPAREGLPSQPVTALLAVSADHCYAGLDGEGIWMTEDAGESWQLTAPGLPDDARVNVLAKSATDDWPLYAGISLQGTQGGAYYLASPEADWEPLLTQVPGQGQPLSGVRAWLVEPGEAGQDAALYLGTERDGVFRSLDTGKSWEALNRGLPLLAGSDQWLAAVTALAREPQGERLGALVGEGYFVYVGDSWRRISDTAQRLAGSTLLYHPSDSDVIWCGGAGRNALKSQDAGQTWQRMVGPPAWGFVGDLVLSSVDPDTLYAAVAPLLMSGGHLGGVLRSIDGGESWTDVSAGITALDVTGVVVDPDDAQHILVSTGSGHILATVDGGTTWTKQLWSRAPISELAISPADPDTVYVVAEAVHRSTDGGETFSRIAEITLGRALAFGPAGESAYIGSAIGRGVYASHDGGTSWTLHPLPEAATGQAVASLTIESPAGTVWAGLEYSGGLWASDDGGLTWRLRGFGDARVISALGVLVEDDVILAGVRDPDGSIFWSDDDGRTWTLAIQGVGTVGDYWIGENAVYAATGAQGVLHSEDGGATWRSFDRGLFPDGVYTLAGEEETYLLVATQGGLYRLHWP
jgi:photosystem II stability/assembly factor-like uncharacterized protein